MTAAIPVRLLLEKGSTIRGSKAYRLNRDRDDFARALAFLADHPSLFAPVISAVRPWLRGPDDVRLATGLKVVFTKNIHGMRRSGEVAFHV